jgi:hypothetical protein
MNLNTKIKVNDLKLTVLIIASLFILGQAFFTLAEEKNNPTAVFLDSDQDGLSDEEEKLYGTNPSNADSDGDGYKDGKEVQAGYNPLKPSPGDKLETVRENVSVNKNNLESSGDTTLTKKLVAKVNDQLKTNDLEDVTMSDVESLANDFLKENTPVSEFSKITLADIKIKKQNYSKLSAKEAQEKKTEDFTDYTVSLFYTLSLQAEKPILSSQDFDTSFAALFEEISSAITSADLNYLNELDVKTQKFLKEMKNIEVPEEFQELHLKAINSLAYGISLKNQVKTTDNDSIATLIGLTQIQGFLEDFSNFLTEVSEKTSQYPLDNILVKNRLNALGIGTNKTITH